MAYDREGEISYTTMDSAATMITWPKLFLPGQLRGLSGSSGPSQSTMLSPTASLPSFQGASPSSLAEIQPILSSLGGTGSEVSLPDGFTTEMAKGDVLDDIAGSQTSFFCFFLF